MLEFRNKDPKTQKKWTNLFDKSLTGVGMALSYIPPDEVEGHPVVKIKPQDRRKIEMKWEFVNMLFTLDTGVEVVNVQNYVRIMWLEIVRNRIIKHKDGYFFVSLEKCEGSREYAK